MLHGVEHMKNIRMAMLPRFFIIFVVIVGTGFAAVKGTKISKSTDAALSISIGPEISELGSNSFANVTNRTTFYVEAGIMGMKCDAFGGENSSRQKRQSCQHPRAILDSGEVKFRGRRSHNRRAASLEQVEMRACIENGTLVKLKILEKGKASTDSNCGPVTFADGEMSFDVGIKIRKLEKGWCCSGMTNATGFLENEVKEYGGIGISLHSTGITEIPINAFANAPSLRAIYLSSNNLTDTKIVANLPSSVRKLFLSNNLITKIEVDSFSHLEKLQHLQLDNNQIMTLEPRAFENNPKLRMVYLNHNRISSLVAGVFTGLPYLYYISLADNKLTKIPANVFNLTQLAVLDLANNEVTVIETRAFEHEGFNPELGSNKTISTFNLRWNSLTDTKIVANLTSTLENLILSHNKITKIEAKCFSHLGKLEYLDLQLNEITTLEPRAFENNLKLQVLNLNHNRIFNLAVGVFTKLPALHDLYLIYNRLTKIPANVFDLASLHKLHLSHNNIAVVESGAFNYTVIPNRDSRRQRYFYLDISFNFIETLQNGAFAGLPKVPGCYVLMESTQTKVIHGGLFDY